MALWLLAAFAEPGDGLPELPRSLFRAAVEAESRGDDRQASVFFRQVTTLAPDYTPGWCRLGDALASEGRVAEAVEAWEGAPFDPDCVESLGHAALDRGDAEGARRMFQRLSGLRSADPSVELLLGRAALDGGDVESAEDALRRFLERGAPLDDGVLPLVEGLVDVRLEEPEIALGWLDTVQSAYPELEDRLAELRSRSTIERRAREHAGAGAISLTSEQEASLGRARRAFDAGRTAEALEELEGLVGRATRNPDVWAALADVREASGDIGGAETALLLATRLAPQRGALHARMGQLLATRFGGRFDAEALDRFDRALETRDDAEYWVCVAVLAGRTRDFDRASAALVHIGDTEIDGHSEMCALPSSAAQRALDLSRQRAEPPLLPRVGPPDGVSEEAWLAVHRAQVLFDMGETQRALDETNRAVEMNPKLTRALNLQGHLRTRAEDYPAAVRSYEASLASRADQAAVMAALAELYRLVGRESDALEMRAAAAEAGSPLARYQLALEAADAGNPWQAQADLDAYFEVASSGALHPAALALRERVRRDIRNVRAAVVAGGLGGVALVVLLGLAFWRRRSGAPLSELLERAPATYRDVARILSSVRHEVLKHNISALPGVADALEAGDPVPAMWLADRLFGPSGAVRRFDRYMLELDELGRSHQVALNLRHRDPVLGPLIAGMDRLRRLRRSLERGNASPADVRAISTVLNTDGYPAVGRLLEGVCVVSLESAMFDTALQDVMREPAFVDGPQPDWSAPDGSFAVRIFRGDLHDILVNLLRNAWAASLECGAERLAVRLDIEEDDITGLERVEIRVADDAPRRISTAMIRGRYIDRGLGLAVDLISRAGGSIHVEDEPGFSKAVVVRLPRSST